MPTVKNTKTGKVWNVLEKITVSRLRSDLPTFFWRNDMAYHCHRGGVAVLGRASENHRPKWSVYLVVEDEDGIDTICLGWAKERESACLIIDKVLDSGEFKRVFRTQ